METFMVNKNSWHYKLVKEYVTDKYPFDLREKGFTNVTGSFFIYSFRPGGLGGTMNVFCVSTGETLDLSLIDDEEF